MTAEEAIDQAHEEAPVKITAELLGPATGIDEEVPEDIFYGGASELG
jgi:hypothetical protein